VEFIPTVGRDRNLLGNAHFHLGCIYQSLGEREKAGREFEACLKLIPDHKKGQTKFERIRITGPFKRL